MEGDIGMKKIFSVILLTMAVCNVSMAETVVVSGSGSTRDAAINDAKRNAVEKVVGSYISSKTVVNSPYVIKDEINSQAYGFVKDIQILRETKGQVYEVEARVDVDTSPDSQLMNKLETLRVLNNPRISVAIKHNAASSQSAKYINLCETIITQKLNELGFSRIVDKAKVWQRKNEGRGETVISKSGGVQSGVKTTPNASSNTSSKTSSGNAPTYANSGKRPQVYRTESKKDRKPELPKPGPIDYEAYLPNSDTDFFIFGSLEFSTSKVMHPVYQDLREQKPSNFDTGFQKTTATLEIKILKSDTMNQVGIHSLVASSMHSDPNVAERDAVQKVANKAAEKIAESFAKKGASIESGFEMQVQTDQENLDKLLGDIKKASGVRNVKIRNYQNGKAFYEVEGDLTPFDLFRQLQQASRFRITRLNVTDNLLEIMVV